MAKVTDNVLVKGFYGSIGRTLTFKQIGGQTFVSKYQKAPTVATTEKAVAARTKFGRATAYARTAVKNPELKALYQALVKGGQRAFNVAMTDALQAPVVERIVVDNYRGQAGDQIVVHATDDFKVASVLVSIHDLAGILIEQGNAVMQENEEKDWIYIVEQENPVLTGTSITAIATDLPGNSASLSISIS